MSDERLWNAYRGLKGQSNLTQAVRVLQQCIDEGTDSVLVYCANRDLGMLYAQEETGMQDVQKAKKYLGDAALEAILHGYEKPDVYDEISCQTMGQLLFAEGDARGFYFLKEALKLGSLWAAWLLYQELHKRAEDDGFTGWVQERVRKEISDLYAECTDAISEDELPAVKLGVPQFALAMVGLYRLGDGVGIDAKQGMEYLKQAKALGNGHAEDVLKYRELQEPETFLNAVEKLQNGSLEPKEVSAGKAEEGENRKTKKRKSKLPILLLLCVVAIVLFLGRNVIIDAVKGLFGILVGVGAVALLLVCLYIYGEDGDSESTDSGWVKPEKTGFSFPRYLIDNDGNTWELMNDSGDNATYQGFGSAAGQTRWVHASEFDCGLPSGFYRRG